MRRSLTLKQTLILSRLAQSGEDRSQSSLELGTATEEQRRRPTRRPVAALTPLFLPNVQL